MATPKLDKIITNFLGRIGDPPTFTLSVLQDGNILTAAKAVTFVNRAMMKMLNDAATSVQFDTNAISKIFPELNTSDTITTTSGGNYSISSNKIRDIWLLLGCSYTPAGGSITLIAKQDSANYMYFITGKNSNLTATSSRPAVFYIQNNLVFLPASSFNAQSVSVFYLRLPLNPTDGTALTQNGSYDSPFLDIWNDRIAEIAQQLYMTEAQET